MLKAKKIIKIPISKRRGLEGPFDMDLSIFALLVRADIGRVTERLTILMKAKGIKKAVSRNDLTDCDILKCTYCPFQLRGHSWTTVLHRLDEKFRFSPLLAKKLSARLKTRVIFTGAHDTAGTIDYILYENGKLSEVFHWHDLVKFHKLTFKEFTQVEKNPLKTPYGFYAASEVRDIPVDDYRALLKKRGQKFNRHIEKIIDDFLRSQDAFLSFNLINEPGSGFFPSTAIADEILQVDKVEI